ncbi:hypothetical protein BDK92_7192 [Micromonospora pisi]|uniref:Uncharacterized protein n=1 Tax=Micromonospora pisi TaxID=589240 RepID=A0A495JWS7_9ACTN|nr:hypothetical protein [Micromonospora pisi]RKR92714.1 hypothetical protein BDK92_7192 [Micromonospora pisi]
MSDTLTLALAAYDEADPDNPAGRRVHAAALFREATGATLRDSLAAVDEVIAERTTFENLEQFRQPTTFGWRYEFPNNRMVTVINDDTAPFRFEVLSDDPADVATGNIRRGLTTEQVEAKLVAIYGMPAV